MFTSLRALIRFAVDESSNPAIIKVIQSTSSSHFGFLCQQISSWVQGCFLKEKKSEEKNPTIFYFFFIFLRAGRDVFFLRVGVMSILVITLNLTMILSLCIYFAILMNWGLHNVLTCFFSLSVTILALYAKLLL